MPRKVRQLIADLEKAGFVNRGGKGNHRNFVHPKGQRLTISGGAGDDAFPYREGQMHRRIRGIKAMKTSELKAKAARYMKIVEWSDEDGCFVGSAPPLIGQCCHGKDETKVYSQLCRIVEEWIAILETDGRELPEPLDAKKFSRNNMLPSR